MRRTVPNKNPDDLAREVADLCVLSRKELRERWRLLFDAEPHAHMSRELLTSAVAYWIQENALGGLRPATRNVLARIVQGSSGQSVRVASDRKASAGTVLIREWQGSTHQVTVLDEGVIYRGQRLRSLSEAARVITGARWSGPLFFGLKTRGKERRNGTD